MSAERKTPPLVLPADLQERLRHQAGKAGIAAQFLLSVAMERGIQWAEQVYVPEVEQERARVQCRRAAAARRARLAPRSPARRARRRHA